MKPRSFSVYCVLILLGLSAVVVGQTEYFVSLDGSDLNDGKSHLLAFATIQRGVDALNAGDTLTILPGRYNEAVAREGLGAAGVETVIRALIPGTVELRGDVPAPHFSPVEGFRFVYVGDFEAPVQAVIDVNSFEVLKVVPDIAELEFNPGSIHHDVENGRLYLSTPDLTHPNDSPYRVAVLEGRAGLFLHQPVNVTVDGLGFFGFHSASPLPSLPRGLTDADQIVWGLYLANALNCTVRNVTAAFNGGGVGVRNSNHVESGGNSVEDSLAFGNAGSGFALYRRNGDLLSGLHAYHNGIRAFTVYATSDGAPAELRYSLGWGSPTGRAVQGKAGGGSTFRNSVGLGIWGSVNDRFINNLITASGDIPPDFIDNIDPQVLGDVVFEEQFADPDNLDFRLQADSVFRGAGIEGADLGPYPYEDNVFFVSRDGNDAADGRSVASAWATLGHAIPRLRAGDTLYISSGHYSCDLELTSLLPGPDGDGVAIRGRGVGAVVLDGAVRVAGLEGVELQRLQFSRKLEVDGVSRLRLINCRFEAAAALIVSNSSEVWIMHNEFYTAGGAAIRLDCCSEVFLGACLFAAAGAAAVETAVWDSIRYSDYNAYTADAPLWRVGGRDFDLDGLRARGMDRYSVVCAAPVAAARDGGGFPPLPELRGAGPFGKPIGVYLPQRFAAAAAAAPLRVAGPFVHSVTDTTVNIEWWKDGPAATRIAWSERGATGEWQEVKSYRFHSFSLTGLEPDREYEVRVAFDRPVEIVDAADSIDFVEAEGFFRVRFRTAAEPRNPVTLYVAADGDDGNSGLSLDQPLRTINRAAALVLPGDTVRVAAGVYTEAVRVRATGCNSAPIRFTSVPGDRVEISGGRRALSFAFLATHKHFIHIDSFYFRQQASVSLPMPWADERRWSSSAGVVLYRCSDIQVSRIFHDQRGQGYGPGILQAVLSPDVSVTNSVIIASMGGGVSFMGAPNLRLQNNVFLRNLIAHVAEGVNESDQQWYLLDNIVTDNLASKVRGTLFAVGRVESLVEDNNCYFFRIPAEERNVFQFYHDFAYNRSVEGWNMGLRQSTPTVIEALTAVTIPELLEVYFPDSRSFVADPDFAGAAGLDPQDRAAPAYVVDWLVGQPDLDFNDLFATDPKVVERGIGLQPAAFADFTFD